MVMAAAAARRLPFLVVSLAATIPTHPLRCLSFPTPVTFASLKTLGFASAGPRKFAFASFCSDINVASESIKPLASEESSKQGSLKPGLYLVGTPIGNLEDITFRALRVLKSADVILSEDTRHSGKLLHYFGIKTPIMSYHKFNESQRERTVLQRLQQGQIVALISDAGMPGISDPGTYLASMCIEANILVVPIPGPSAVIAALSASGLPTDEFTFVGFLPKHAGSRKEKLLLSANQTATQIFFVPPHKLQKFIEESSSIFGDSRRCVIAREMTKIHEEFWRGTLEEAKKVYSDRQPKGEITFLIEGKSNVIHETPTESEVEDDLGDLISSGHSISMAVKLVAEGLSMKRKEVYSIALRKFRKQNPQDDH